MAAYHGTGEDPQPRRPVTRSLVRNGLIFFASPSSVKAKKNVKFVDPNYSVLHNSSVATDEGVDVSFSSCTGSISVPASVARSQHSLNSAWSFWFSSGNKRASWKQNQIVLANLTSVEEFWNTYNKVDPCYLSRSFYLITSLQVQPSSQLAPGQSYSVFRSGVVPDWEDPANARGGRWMICFDTEERQTKLDDRWLELLIMVLGDRAGSIVTGIICLVRQGRLTRLSRSRGLCEEEDGQDGALGQQHQRPSAADRGRQEAEDSPRSWQVSDQVFNPRRGEAWREGAVSHDMKSSIEILTPIIAFESRY